MQDNSCVSCLCACACEPSPWLGTYVGVRGKYAKRPFIAFWVSLKLARAWRARTVGPPRCGWIQAMPLLQVVSPQGGQCFDHCRVVSALVQHNTVSRFMELLLAEVIQQRQTLLEVYFERSESSPERPECSLAWPCAGAVAVQKLCTHVALWPSHLD